MARILKRTQIHRQSAQENSQNAGNHLVDYPHLTILAATRKPLMAKNPFTAIPPIQMEP